MGASNAQGLPSRANNSIQDFDVNGEWAEAERRAAYLFSKVVNYGNGPGGQQLVNSPHASGFNQTAYFAALANAANSFVVGAERGAGTTLSWLNAYNAPHWLNIPGSGIPGWNNSQTGSSSPQLPNETLPQWKARTGQVEYFGTSWLRDVMVASSSAAPALRGARQFLFNGAVDANHGFTPSGHGSHDLGMALDLGIRAYVSASRPAGGSNNGNQFNSQETVTVVANAVGWSNDNAVSQAGQSTLLETAAYYQLISGVNVNLGSNRQQSAVKDFLSLYAVTRDGGGTGAANQGSRTTLTLRARVKVVVASFMQPTAEYL